LVVYIDYIDFLKNYIESNYIYRLLKNYIDRINIKM